MKKIWKQLSAVVVGLIMIIAMMSTSVFAESITQTSKTDTAKVTISGLEDGATVNFYRVVEPVYGADGKNFQSYNALTVGGTKIKDITNPTQAEIEAIYTALKAGDSGLTPVTKTAAEAAAGVDLGAGTWIAVVTGGNSIYNPMVASVNYKTENGSTVIDGGSINAATDKLTLDGKELYAKKSEPQVEKKVKEDNADVDNRSASVGDQLDFEITADKPAYPENATNKTFFIADEMSEGLTYIPDSLKVNGIAPNAAGEIISGGDVIARVKVEGQKINVAFVYDKINDKPSVTYSAVLNDKAVVGTNANTNTVDLYYSTNPTNGGDSITKPDTPPNPEDGYGKDKDIVKIYTYQVAFKKTDDATENAKKLAGAVYGIYKDADCTDLIDTAESNTEGIGTFKQIEIKEGDIGKTYYIKELVAPTGYSLDTKVYNYTITKADVNKTTEATVREYTTVQSEAIDDKVVGYLNTADPADTTLYPEKIDENYKEAYIKSSTTTTSTEIAGGTDTVEVGPFKDTKISELPSTGGIGTYLFTVVGVVVMAVMAGMFFIKRRREAE
ncbi:MAG: SpaA isopeptide-forming pilin-related protein [Eubacteriales bacterium]|nr:SpaA isopeptide-forming pilin-related protein [Eubacteriales bacterium]